ncbi:Mitochondrial import inner membrane translocase subunit tim22 [Paramyrothecium foliicola]|nr:Mitochondrial import inner membrane translocase subunit tim22 [Paramyrothecium foliicola]
MINLNLSASLNIFKILFRPSLCLPHQTVSTFNELPIPLEKGLQTTGRRANIKAVVLDKDDCFAYPESNEVYPAYKHKEHFEALRAAYPGRRLLVVSNTAGAKSWDKDMALAAELEQNTGIFVLPHSTKKPGCGAEIMEYFRNHPETGVTDPAHIAVVGDRLTTDMMLANLMGGWGFWLRDGVVPMKQKNIFSRIERPLASFLQNRGIDPPEPCLNMGGKTWSKEEETYFWHVIIPQSPKAIKESDRAYSWTKCAEIMQEAMSHNPRRRFTYLMLSEHFYQNVHTGHFSPFAREFVEEYKTNVASEELLAASRLPSKPRRVKAPRVKAAKRRGRKPSERLKGLSNCQVANGQNVAQKLDKAFLTSLSGGAAAAPPPMLGGAQDPNVRAMQAAMESCLGKSVMSGVMGFGMGGLFGMFMASMSYDTPYGTPVMGPNQTPLNSLPLKEQLRHGFKDMGTRSYSMAKNFGKVGALFAGIECGVEGLRAKNDLGNGVVSGCLTGGILARNAGPQAVAGGCVAFAAFSAAIDAWMRQPKDE